MKTIQAVREPDASTDDVVSTCALRLTEKTTLFANAFLMLSPGGSLAISDVIAVRADASHLDAHAARVSAAAQVHRLCTMLCDIGFVDVRIDIEARMTDGDAQYVVSAAITATKPC